MVALEPTADVRIPRGRQRAVSMAENGNAAEVHG
jgi:hypothetical protein